MGILLQAREDGCGDGYYRDRNGYCRYRGDRWGGWGRWVVLAAVLVGAFFIFFAFACLTARRRRKRGMNPYRGTGWAAGRTPAGHAPAQYTGAQPYYAGNQGQNQPAPPYSPTNNQAGNQGYYGNTPGNQGYYGNNQDGQGFFGGQQNGVELQQPNSTYQPQRGGDAVYSPPPGPPPGKGGDGIIR
ncbi:hypothetical protein G7Y79_00015g039200 [Physcia stellaris]|nr:hypothetical protein G7Y79_00015g039200 [Physcia stellaris]